MYKPKYPMLTRESNFYDIVFETLRQAPDGKKRSIELISIGQRRLGVSAPTVRNYLNALLCLEGNPLIKIGSMVVLQHTPTVRPERYCHGNIADISEPVTAPDIRHRETEPPISTQPNTITNYI